MPKGPRKHRPDRAKAGLTSFLQTKCFVCLDSPNEHPSRPLLCCRKYIHEECPRVFAFRQSGGGRLLSSLSGANPTLSCFEPKCSFGTESFLFSEGPLSASPAVATRSGRIVGIFWLSSGAGWWSLSPLCSSSRTAWLGRIYEPILTISFYTPWVTSLLTVNQQNVRSYLACWRFPASC